VLRKKYVPPFVPQVKDESDATMFDNYPEKGVNPAEKSGLSSDEQMLFTDFNASSCLEFGRSYTFVATL